ncbi:hypothetical protein [Elioraea sp.]|uniref:hypothetical protein n=1 Tax=Elioraea sp. TaxID=2185103 RepID=UPI0025BDAC73|nr:hypothetical protein [Elioraea sp.]
MRIAATIVAGLLLAGCASTVDDIRTLEPADEVRLAAPYDVVATCLADVQMRRMQVVKLDRPREQRATITMFFETSISRQPIAETEVTASEPENSIARLRIPGSIWGKPKAPVQFFREDLAACGYTA